jgi:predicted dienelactone hydrolase
MPHRPADLPIVIDADRRELVPLARTIRSVSRGALMLRFGSGPVMVKRRLLVALATVAVVARGASAAVVDPGGPGPYAVGLTTRTFEKLSATTGEPRTLETLIWYPADPAAPSPAVLRGRWPLLVFSHGSCSIPSQSPFLMEALSSRGMIVAAPPHPGNTVTDCDPDVLDSYLNRVPDVVFVLDQLQLESASRGAFFSRHIHPKRVGIMGHSFGGQTTIRALAADARFRAGLALAPRPATDIVVTQPLLVLTGALDSLTPFETDARNAFASARGRVRYLIRLPDTGHCAPAPVCVPSLCGAGCPPAGIDTATANARVQRVVVPFAMHHVARKGGYKRYLDPATLPAGIEVVEAAAR